MFRAPALVVIVAMSLAAGRPEYLCGARGIEGHEPATCHRATGPSAAATSVSDNADRGHRVAAHQSIRACAEWDSRQRDFRLESGCRVRQAIEEGLPGDTGAALAPLTHRLSLGVDVHTPRRPVEEWVPLERRPLSTNLRI
jgi:hypothetical protein